jgi:hypothetical protein
MKSRKRIRNRKKNEGARKSLFQRRESRWATVLKLIEKAESDEKNDVKVYPGFGFLKG